MLSGHPTAFGLPNLGTVGDAQKDIVGLPLGCLEELNVIGRHQRQIVFDRQLDQRRLDLVFGLEVVAHQLHVQAIREDLGQARENALGEAAVAVQKRLSDLSLGAAGERDQPPAVVGKVVELQLGVRPAVPPR